MKDIFYLSDCVCFDVDSTLCKSEAIDDLAEFLGKREIIESLTTKAMDGSLTFQKAFSQRLESLCLNSSLFEDWLHSYVVDLSEGVEDLINLLKSKKIEVYLVSGGFFQIVSKVAQRLGLKTENIFANKLLFDSKGNYLDFDRNAFTSRSGGKVDALKYLKDECNFKFISMIGDGITDLETKCIADMFIGYGGNVCRKVVQENSKYFITHFDDLIIR